MATLAAPRHDSASTTDSSRSEDTIKVDPQSYNKQTHDDGEISPTSAHPGQRTFAVAPWEEPAEDHELNDSSKLQRLTSPSVPFPSMPESPNASAFYSNGFSSDYFGHPDYSSPGSSFMGRAEALDTGFSPEDRRPSVASGNTASSSGSGTFAGARNKVRQIFGDEPPSPGVRAGMQQSDSGTASPDSKLNSRRQSSQPSASVPPKESKPEVTPWDFQDHEDDLPAGDGSVGDKSNTSDKGRLVDRRQLSDPSRFAHIPRPHGLSLHRHRHQKSGDESKRSKLSSTEVADGGDELKRQMSMSQFSEERYNGGYSKQVSQSTVDENSLERRQTFANVDGASGSGRRSILDRFRHRNKQEKTNPESLKSASESTTSVDAVEKSAKGTKEREKEKETPKQAGRKQGSQTDEPDFAELQRTNTRQSISTGKKEHHSRMPFKKRPTLPEDSIPKNPVAPPPEAAAPDKGGFFSLDTDLSQMEGIVSSEPNTSQPLPTPTTANKQYLSYFGDDIEPADQDSAGAWDAPDSWAVKPTADTAQSYPDAIDETEEDMADIDPTAQYGMRVFLRNGTTTPVTMPLNTTAEEIVKSLMKTFDIQGDEAHWHLVLKRSDISRQLYPHERPLNIQRKIFHQAGYEAKDDIPSIGLEDHSFLCQFSFVNIKTSAGFSSLVEKDPGFSKTQKLATADLQGLSLITIPIALYSKATEIVTLNLSRNIALDVPKDFIKSCSSLYEIRFNRNQARKLPASFSLAKRLVILDVSNNRLDELDHANLHSIETLCALKIANNRLSSLPADLGKLKNLRNLNISSNSFTEVPACLGEISTLNDLDISFNALTSLAPLARVRGLERLWATNNKLAGKLDESLASLTSLREMDIRFNSIENVDVCSKMPALETLLVGHNFISAFEGSFLKIKTFLIDHNPVTFFNINKSTDTLQHLSLASAQLSHLPEELFGHMPSLSRFVLDKNHFSSLSPEIGLLRKLEYFSMARNSLTSLPPELGLLSEIRFLDLRENNIERLPQELWFCRKLETLNMSCNVLKSLPKPPTHIPSHLGIASSVPPTPSAASENGPELEEHDTLGELGSRRMSQASSQHSFASSPGTRKNSVTSVQGGRKQSLYRVSTESNMANRKESVAINRSTQTFVGTLKNLFLADNRLSEDVWDQLQLLEGLRVVNLSHNDIYDIPHRSFRRWHDLTELYLSGNGLTSLPSEDFEEIRGLRTLHINDNKFQTLPAELGKIVNLTAFDVASNNLKYNVWNFPFDWNWNSNPYLKYLNLSGNKRLEIRPAPQKFGERADQGRTDFSCLKNLRMLGLMDVTLMIESVPDNNEDRRVRLSGSTIGSMPYGISDTLGRNEHLSTMDFITPRLKGNDNETLIGLVDGVNIKSDTSMNSDGSKVVTFVQQNFEAIFKKHLEGLAADEAPTDAMRRTFLNLNSDFAAAANANRNKKQAMNLSDLALLLTPEDLASACVATVLYLHGPNLCVANVGDIQAVMVQNDGHHRFITQKHDPASAEERKRIRDVEGFVSRQGRLNDVLEVSRAFGFTLHEPCVIAAPSVSEMALTETDELLVMASRDLWDYLAVDFIVDVARSEREDLMRAAQKLRDFAIAFGASSKLTVMVIGISEFRRRERAKMRSHSMSLGPSGLPDEYMAARRSKRTRDATVDSKLARLDQEVEAPSGELSLVFTDIKNSTLLWETFPIAMRSALKLHNDCFRRHIRLIGGFEVKTEGDAFMVAFQTVTSALLWCFTVQMALLEVQWPQEIVNSVHGQEVRDAEGNILFKGLSVRMGIHSGTPVCDLDPVTKRMDYLGPMVNRSARISSVADGGQITVSNDFIGEIQKLLEQYSEADDRSDSGGSEGQMNENLEDMQMKRELRSLQSQGFVTRDLGERRLKGLENPEYIYLMYPHALSGRWDAHIQRIEAEKTAAAEAASTKERESQLSLDLDNVWDLWGISLRLEMLCSTLECRGSNELKPPETALLEKTKERSGEVTDHFLVNFVEHQISRIETCINSLALRHMVRPFKKGLLDQACPMSDIFKELAEQLAELKSYRDQIDIDMAPS